MSIRTSKFSIIDPTVKSVAKVDFKNRLNVDEKFIFNGIDYFEDHLLEKLEYKANELKYYAIIVNTTADSDHMEKMGYKLTCKSLIEVIGGKIAVLDRYKLNQKYKHLNKPDYQICDEGDCIKLVNGFHLCEVYQYRYHENSYHDFYQSHTKKYHEYFRKFQLFIQGFFILFTVLSIFMSLFLIGPMILNSEVEGIHGLLCVFVYPSLLFWLVINPVIKWIPPWRKIYQVRKKFLQESPPIIIYLTYLYDNYKAIGEKEIESSTIEVPGIILPNDGIKY